MNIPSCAIPLLLIVGAGAGSVLAPLLDPSSGQDIVLKDDQGRTRLAAVMRAGGPELALFDVGGRPRISLRLTGDGSGVMEMLDEDGKPCVELTPGATPEEGRFSIRKPGGCGVTTRLRNDEVITEIAGPEGVPMAVIEAGGRLGATRLVLLAGGKGRTGQSRCVVLQADQEGAGLEVGVPGLPSLEVKEVKGQSALIVGAEGQHRTILQSTAEAGSTLTLLDAEGRTRGLMQSTPRHGTGVVVKSGDGVAQITLAMRPDGKIVHQVVDRAGRVLFDGGEVK